MRHSFHIPVLGLAFSIDTPLKVAKYGINSVLSIVDDELIERMREYYSRQYHLPFEPIQKTEEDARARRITAYLDMAQEILNLEMSRMQEADLRTDADIRRYFMLLPDDNAAKKQYQQFVGAGSSANHADLEITLRQHIQPGDIEVNIMSKVDKVNLRKNGEALAAEYTDASAALRGFARSKLQSSVVLSAGMNPRLYAYLTEFDCFFPDTTGYLAKKIILKVSDYRSALIQAKVLAKKGIWVSEYRIESGLNCGGHAFATDGFLMGPILEEFKQKRTELIAELSGLYKVALEQRGILWQQTPSLNITAQGGIGTAEEQRFLLEYYQLDRTGWGSPFLLVPDATTLDDRTLHVLAQATPEDFYLSNASPLGVPFQNFGPSTAEQNRRDRIAAGKPGAPCTKKYLVSNTEFTEEPICTASRKYQHRKIKELNTLNLHPEAYQRAYERIVEKLCLCEGLASAAYLKYEIQKPKENTAVAICPGPNTVYFKGIFSLEEMIDHIYGRTDLLAHVERAHMFINELQLYVNYIQKYIQDNLDTLDNKKEKYITKFRTQLQEGIQYYENIAHEVCKHSDRAARSFLGQLALLEKKLKLS